MKKKYGTPEFEVSRIDFANNLLNNDYDFVQASAEDVIPDIEIDGDNMDMG